MALTLLMARHGQTDLNTDERWQGRLDEPLNAAGRTQAEQLAQSLPGGIQALVVSPMLRAHQTAEPVVRALGLVPRFDPDFRERDFGIFEGLTAEEAAQQFPELAARNVAYRWDEEPPGAEPTRAVVDRVAAGLARLCEQHADQTVLLVTHGFVVRCLRYLIDGLSRDAFFEADPMPNGIFLRRQLP